MKRCTLLTVIGLYVFTTSVICSCVQLAAATLVSNATMPAARVVHAPFTLTIAQDPNDPAHDALFIGQAGLQLPGPESARSAIVPHPVLRRGPSLRPAASNARILCIRGPASSHRVKR
ncbi:MAG: hypothetical protein ABI837_08395 [Acidobacteriota bacterium]